MTDLASALLAWFDQSARVLPWRMDRTPYRVFLSEYMLQQTQVQTVIPYYHHFLERWPDFASLAEADEQDVLKAWEGLGYYSRARNLLRAAQMIVTTYDGTLPDSEDELLRLPGIGAYTAGAIRSIAWNQPVAAVDGNVVRVYARIKAAAWVAGNPADRAAARACVEADLPSERAGDFNEALMDLGATICLPRQPRCADCPLRAYCAAFQAGCPEQFPLRAPKKTVPTARRTVLVFLADDRVHVRRRPADGLLAGLYEFDWLADNRIGEQSVLSLREQIQLPQSAQIAPLRGHRHRFTHRIWDLSAAAVRLARPDDLPAAFADPAADWIPISQLVQLPFPTALQPILRQIETL